MNKYFTKEYAKLCENEKIQNLQFNYREQDCYFNDTGPLIWLPASENLDEEIFKILENWSKDVDIEYSFEVSFIDGKRTAYQLTISNRDGEHIEMDTNPLVVKIKTLISLLEEAK